VNTTIYLVRTGQTTWDAEGRVPGGVDVPLTEAGQAESAATAEGLVAFKPVVVYRAPGEAAKATARIIAKKLHTRPRALADLADVNFGLWQGMRWSEVAARHPKAHRRLMEEPLSVAPPEGEALRDVLQRVRVAVAALAGKHPGEAIVVVCSADVCGFVGACVEGGRVAPPRPAETDKCQWRALEIQVAEPEGTGPANDGSAPEGAGPDRVGSQQDAGST